MNKHIITCIFLLSFIFVQPLASFAHEPGSGEIVFVPKKFYVSSDFDGFLFTVGLDNGERPLNLGQPTKLTTPRFTYFFNIGFHLNYDFGKSVGLFTGVSVKNMGFIEKQTLIDSTIKRRVYAAGIPLGIKIGDLSRKNYAFLGGGVDFPLNYREKGFVKRNDKDKFNEWFSDRVPAYMPYAFIGASVKPGVFIKVQYYPGNFMNPDYSETVNINGTPTVIKPYSLYDVQLLMFSFGFNIRYSTKMKINHKDHDGNLEPIM